jgi:hypothetical protein
MTLPSLSTDLLSYFNTFVAWDLVKGFTAMVLGLTLGGVILNIVANRLTRH